MFSRTARFYDAMYSFKNYAAEAAYVHELIEHYGRSGGNRLLDVACGTGKHAEELSSLYDVDGMDLDEGLLAIARERCPYLPFYAADMVDFDLEQKYDAVVCLFSSIGYAHPFDQMAKAMASMAKHLVSGGVLLVEPWLYKDNFESGHINLLTFEEPHLKIARMAHSERTDDLSTLDFEYLIGTPEGMTRETERHELGLYSSDQYDEAMRMAGLQTDYDPIGPMGRGLFVGMKP